MRSCRRFPLSRRRALVMLCIAAALRSRRDGAAYAFSIRVNTRSATRRSSRTGTELRAELSDEDYSRLMRRMARLEKIVSDQNAEVEEMRSSMEHMRTIVQIQAQIDSCLVDGGENELLLSSSLEGGAGGEPDPRLVKQAIRLLRVRHRVLRAWDFDGEQVTASPPSEDDDDPAPRRMNGSSDAENNDSSSSSSSSNSDMPSGSGDAVRRRHRSGRTRRRDERSWDFEHEDADDAEFFESSNLYDDPPMEGGEVGRGVWGGGRRSSSSSSSSRGNSGDVGEAFEPRRGKQRPPKTNQDAAEAAGAGIVAALMEGRRRLIVEVDDPQLRYSSPYFCHEAMAEFVELLFLPLTTALENLKAKQNRCKIVIHGAHNVDQFKEAMVLDAPASLQVVSLEEGHVATTDRVVALVSPEHWKGKKGKHLKRLLAEARDAAIILINPTDAHKFLRPADYNTFEAAYHLRPCFVSYLQPLPPPQEYPPLEYNDERADAAAAVGGGGAGSGFRGGQDEEPSGEELLLERLGESVLAEEQALEAAAAAAAAAATPGAADGDNGGDALGGEAGAPSPFDGASGVGAAVAAEIGVRAAERALARAALEFGTAATGGGSGDQDWGGLDLGYRDSGSEWAERDEELMSDEAAAAAMAAWSEGAEGEGARRAEGGRVQGEKELRWAEGEVGEWDGVGADEAAEISALAVTLRRYPDAWEAFVDLHDGMGFRLCGTWDREPPQTAVKTVVMDHILRIVMD